MRTGGYHQRGLRRAPTRAIADQSAGLAEDLVFLRRYGVPLSTLRRADNIARRQGVAAADALIASGLVSPYLFYKSLADHLGVPFVPGRAALALPLDPATCLQTAAAPMALGGPAAWLVAPQGTAVSTLLAAHRRFDIAMPDLALTTPSTFFAAVSRAAGSNLAQEASHALATRDARLSSRDALGARFRWGLGAVVVAIAVLASAAPIVAASVVSLVFLAAIAARLLISAAGLTPPAPEPAPLSDTQLPTYSVLVPLYREEAIVPALVARLDALLYPRAKLQILLLVEADDTDTHRACLSAGLSAIYDIVVVPPGFPRTKPRALNVALRMLRGTLVTVFDAEDAPDPLQLRRAAALFHHASGDVACLQAKLAIGNAAKGWLPHLFALEYAALFDLFNPGVAALGLPMALGGTSNHFRGIF